MNLNNSITDVSGILVGHAQDDEALTGCTVVLCEDGAVGGMDQRGGAPGTRQTDSLHPMRVVPRINGVLLSGGSGFGLEASTGVIRYLEERGIGFDTRIARVPIVPTAILFDLNIGRSDVRPDAAMGYQACLNASSDPPSEGNFGAGTGATVGKILGLERAMKSGIGSASVEIGEGIVIGALAAVNAFGDIIDPQTNQIVAGARAPGTGIEDEPGSPGYFADSLQVMKSMSGRTTFGPVKGTNTVIGVVATNAKLDKDGASKMAQMAHDGLARAVRPAHTMLDGDTIFAISTGVIEADVNIVGAFAAEVFSQAILRAVFSATPVAGLPAAAK